jgi:hypothetical protein
MTDDGAPLMAVASVRSLDDVRMRHKEGNSLKFKEKRGLNDKHRLSLP